MEKVTVAVICFAFAFAVFSAAVQFILAKKMKKKNEQFAKKLREFSELLRGEMQKQLRN